MDSSLGFKVALIVVLLLGAAASFVATDRFKKHYGLSDVHLGLDPGYGAGDFKAVMKPDPPKPADRAARFIMPILFPVDLALLLCAGGFAALLSVTLGAPARVPVQIIPLLALVPVLYMAADLIEDILFAWLLTGPDPDAIPENLVGVSRMATIAKLYLFGLGVYQLLALVVMAAYFRLRS